MKYFLSLLILLFAICVNAQVQEKTKLYSEVEQTAIKLADDQLIAYNNRDIDAFLEPYSEDVEVYTFPSDLMYKGKDEMRKRYNNMFNNTPDLHCIIKTRTVQKNYLIDQEEVIKNGKIINAVAIYEIENNKISKVYFLP